MEPYNIDDILTKEEQTYFGWETKIETTEWYFTEHFIVPLLSAASYVGGGQIISILADAPSYSVIPVLSVMKKRLKTLKKDDWRILHSGLAVIGKMIIQHRRNPELPEVYLLILNTLLSSKIKTLRESTAHWVLIICFFLYDEFEISHYEHTKRDMEKVARIINPNLLKASRDLRFYVNSWMWGTTCSRIIGRKWEYASIEPNYNSNILERTLKEFWPDFTISTGNTA